ncbi:MAG TPA: penicillin-binding transpeptidase domain-containing protein [Vicinamibacterales bacterium]|nr:penicillin-binding transpeptidase domain-containing protein [Vicinamibacterales bacterium]
MTLPILIAAQGAPTVPDLSRHFEGLDGTFVLLNGATGAYIRHNPARAAQRFAPCSTFKIPHTAILLESGAAPDPTFTLKYDPTLNQQRNWARDFTLRDAFKASALWYYQALARQLGMPAEDRFVRQFQYGNTDTTGGLGKIGSPYWVDGSLRISANEQVDFLKRFYEGRLGVSPSTTTLTKDIMLAEQTPSWRLSAKTGACQPSGLDTANWYVGYVEKADAVYYFALEIGAKDYGRAFSERIQISRAILTELGILD